MLDSQKLLNETTMTDENTPTVADEPQAKPATMSDQDNDTNFVVGWEEPSDQDPDNPLNWSTGRKWSIIGILSFITFLTYDFSSSPYPRRAKRFIDLWHLQ